MSRYLVIGGAGYLGLEVVRQLLEKGHDPVVFSNQPSALLEAMGVETVQGDIRNLQELEPVFERNAGAFVVHMASIISIERKRNPILDEVNIEGTRNILALCKKHAMGRLCYVSSVHALPIITEGKVKQEITEYQAEQVIGQYARSKATASAHVLQAIHEGLDVVLVLPSGIVGPGAQNQGMTTPMILDFIQGRLNVYVEGGHDFVDVRDVANGILLAIQKGRTGQSYILSGHYFSIKQVLDLVAEVTGQKPVRIRLPMSLFRAAAALVEGGSSLFRKKPYITSYMAHALDSFELYSHHKASKELGYTVRPMKQTIRDTVASLKGRHAV